MGDQLGEKSLPTHKATQPQNKHIHAPSGIRTHDLSVGADEGSLYPRLRVHCDGHVARYSRKISFP
jgi:hypothetical protein